jgi:S1-C subfamily serine protease
VTAPGRYLGIDEVAVVDSGGRGMQVVRVYQGTPAEGAGLQVGDVIHSANGYLTQEHGNLTWIIAKVPPNGDLQMSVRAPTASVDRLVTARIP